MSWITTDYEKAMRRYLVAELGEAKGERLNTGYESIRNELIKDNFFIEIKRNEPSLSDHGEGHIMDVQNRAFKLIGSFETRGLSAYDVYCLALMILFHDVGNIYGRKEHDSVMKISKIYNKYRVNHENYGEERRVIAFGASAHSGLSKKGDKDTLKYIEKDSIEENEINLPELAAILRFADELAEGKHRTCSFLIENNLYNKESEIFHKYAKVTGIKIDRNLGRIAITYTINVSGKFGECEAEKKCFTELMCFSFFRAIKLDQERRYTKRYSSTLQFFTHVSVLYNFEKDYVPLDLDLKPIIFEDKFPIPGVDFVKNSKDAETEILKINPNFKLEDIVNILQTTKISKT